MKKVLTVLVSSILISGLLISPVLAKPEKLGKAEAFITLANPVSHGDTAEFNVVSNVTRTLVWVKCFQDDVFVLWGGGKVYNSFEYIETVTMSSLAYTEGAATCTAEVNWYPPNTSYKYRTIGKLNFEVAP